MPPTPKAENRVLVEGKFFRRGDDKFFVKGLTYGPFEPGPEANFYPPREQVARDFQQLLDAGANLVRVYHLPPRWFLDLATEFNLQVLVDIAWPKHLCFLESRSSRAEAHTAVRDAVRFCGDHPALFAFSVVNEIPPDVVRWSGARRIEAFIDELVAEAKTLAPAVPCTFTNYPSTEFLNPRSIDFVSYNVYLHEREAFERYLARLQMLADTKPLLLAEVGMDSLREGEQHKCAFLSSQIESAFRAGLAGTIVFSFTDDWYRGGRQIEDWGFGLTDRHRRPKASLDVVRKAFKAAPRFPLPSCPRVSVVVASFNGARTLETCLRSLAHLNYPNYEVILVDDGSTDNTPQIAAQFPEVKSIRHENRGLSAARNTGIAAATGEIVAFTDSDCRADEDWLHYLVGDLLRGKFIGIGGHNLLPPEDSPVAAAVMVSPGGPAHVMLTDTEAEHIPGCNMAFLKWALEEIGGFDPLFRAAGDDVDVCWRLRQRGHDIGFSPSAVVWHYRRSTVKAYLRQQNGYGDAEAMLLRKHPEYFNSLGRSMWNGRIYSASKGGPILERSVIYRGVFGSGLFQKIYAPGPSYGLMFYTSLEYHLLVSAPAFVAAMILPWLWPMTIASVLLSLSACVIAAWQAEIPPKKRRLWSRPLVAFLFLVQPIERGLARYRAQFGYRRGSPLPQKRRLGLGGKGPSPAESVRCYWSDGQVDRYQLIGRVLVCLEREGWQFREDKGWSDSDLEILEGKWSRLKLTTVAEVLDEGRLNLRCRLSTSWSLSARLLFWTVFAAELVLGSFLGKMQPWIWMGLLSMPCLSWLFDREETFLRKAVWTVIESAASELQLYKITAEGGRQNRAVEREVGARAQTESPRPPQPAAAELVEP
jgi:O-antigen biosynthesis protein